MLCDAAAVDRATAAANDLVRAAAAATAGGAARLLHSRSCDRRKLQLLYAVDAVDAVNARHTRQLGQVVQLGDANRHLW